MNTLDDIEKAVALLPPEELAKFREWFEELQARLWDERMERDIKAGKLDWLAQEARSGERLPLPKRQR